MVKQRWYLLSGLAGRVGVEKGEPRICYGAGARDVHSDKGGMERSISGLCLHCKVARLSRVETRKACWDRGREW